MAPKAETTPKVEELESENTSGGGGGNNAADKRNVSFEDEAGFVGQWTLGFLTPVLRFGATKALETTDLGTVKSKTRAEPSYGGVKAEWDKTLQLSLKSGDRPNLAAAIFRAYGPSHFYVAMIYYVVSALLGFVPILILGDIVAYFEQPNHETMVDPWIEVAALGVLPTIIGILQTRHNVVMTHLGVYVRTAVSMLTYHATLRASSYSRGLSSTGEVINIMANDAQQLQRFLSFVGLTLVAPLQIIIAIYLIYNEIGNAVWVGVGFMIVLGPINGLIFGQVSKLRRMVLKHSDKRVKLISEILGGIRIIKFNAWEDPFNETIQNIRQLEMNALTKLAYVIAIGFSLILLSAPILQPVLVFATYTANNTLTASKAFSVIALFNIMRFPFAFLPMGLVQYAQAMIAMGRVTRYLLLPELESYVDYDTSKEEGDIFIENASFGWSSQEKVQKYEAEQKMYEAKKKKSKRGICKKGEKDDNEKNESDEENSEDKAKLHRPILTDMNLHIQPGELVAVVGGVGSGKSSLLSALTGEMELLEGKLSIGVSGDSSKTNLIAYCAQSPFIINSTLRQNVKFNSQPKPDDFYQDCIEAACLSEDLSVLPSEDLTEIGERGINLSGGQKARVALARCMYSTAKIWLLDDPLSAVDAHVGDALMRSIIDPPLLNPETDTKPTRILITHHVHVLDLCDKVVVLKDGKVEHCGQYHDLVAKGIDFAGALEFQKDGEEGEQGEGEEAAVEATKSEEKTNSKKKTVKDSLTSKEERATGSVPFASYKYYAKIGGYWSAFTIITAGAASRGLEIGGSFWLSYWAEQASASSYYINMFTLISLGAVFMTAVRSILLANHRLAASVALHRDLTKSIMSAPISFFDITPIGRVLNRFSADMDKVDLELSSSLSQGISTTFSIVGSVSAIIAATRGFFLLPLIPMSFIYWYLQKWFRKSSTELQRVVSITASPIFVDFSETLNGISTIRAYNLQGKFFDTAVKNFDINNIAYTSLQHANSWLGLRLDVLGGFIGVFVGGLSLITKDSSGVSIPAGWLGLALTYSNELSQYLKHGVRMMANIEAEMNSVERIMYYTESIPAEAPATLPEDSKKASWPEDGSVDMDNVSMRYRDGPLILKGLTLSIRSGEHIGVVGRTGSGKSSLMNALLRIVELAEGKVIISGQDASKVGTKLLRSSLSIIPQDPILFSGSVRYNIDPFEVASDDEVWEILKKVQLDEVVDNLAKKLHEQVVEGGENFSQGQRQLMCIARALLRKPKILIMDEATASIDNATDALIQTMIRENFEKATILTIAHRLNTIMDSDRILVLDDGRVAEFDSPAALLAKKEGGIFKALVEKGREGRNSANPSRNSSRVDLTAL